MLINQKRLISGFMWNPGNPEKRTYIFAMSAKQDMTEGYTQEKFAKVFMVKCKPTSRTTCPDKQRMMLNPLAYLPSNCWGLLPLIAIKVCHHVYNILSKHVSS